MVSFHANMYSVEIKTQRLYKKMAGKFPWLILSYVNLTFFKCLFFQQTSLYILAFYGMCNNFRLQWNTMLALIIWRYAVCWEVYVMSPFLYSKFEIISKLCNSFNSYSNALSQVIFSSRMAFSFYPFSFLPNRFRLCTFDKLNFQPKPFKCLKCWKWPWFYPLHKKVSRQSFLRDMEGKTSVWM